MISVESVVMAVLYLLGAAAVFGLLVWAVSYCESNFPNAGPFFKFIRIFLVVAAVFVLIFFVLALMGHPVFRWTSRTAIGAVSLLWPNSGFAVTCE